MDGATDRYVRDVLRHSAPPPPVQARFFYISPIPIDDPLSPLPPPSTSNVSQRLPPRPFSEWDNAELERAWSELRKTLWKYQSERGEKGVGYTGSRPSSASRIVDQPGKASGSIPGTPRSKPLKVGDSSLGQDGGRGGHHETSETPEGPAIRHEPTSLPDTSGKPFVRAAARPLSADVQARFPPTDTPAHDTHQLDDASRLDSRDPAGGHKAASTPGTKVAVGASRLHQVEMPALEMTPIYWKPVNDVAPVTRATWFYADTMCPVEVAVANMLEAGYVDLQCWTETWKNELECAVEVGAAGEMKIAHRLWPEKPNASESRPSSRRRDGSVATNNESLLRTAATNLMEHETMTPAQQREKAVEAACNIVDISTGPDGSDNKASGTNSNGNRTYASFGVIYANARDARLLKPSLMPSSYYGRRPLANYIRKGYKLGIRVVRGFDQAAWEKLHPSPAGPKVDKALHGTATSESGAPPKRRAKLDAVLARSDRPVVTDLVLVIHGIGQKLSERMESFHFTHAMNALRRQINVEVGSKETRSLFREDMGGIMVLPVNWRHSLSFEEGGYRDGSEDVASKRFTLSDITPDTLPNVRSLVSDVMLDIPYYMSQHQPRMIAAVVREANRVYQLWCRNNPSFSTNGRVHIVGHSLGSVIAIDILSSQPTKIPEGLSDPTTVDLDAENLNHFCFDTSNLYLAGSPVGFFLLLRKGQLLPRIHRPSAAALADPASQTLAICGQAGQYGCIAVDNVYNIINPYDPVAYRLNAAVDAAYAASLKQAVIPSATPGWFGVGTKSTSLFGGSSAKGAYTRAPGGKHPTLPRLPSNVEMATHDFTREEISDRRMLLLNDNGQIDYWLRYGGGTFQIQYLTMIGAHSSYWSIKDFVRMIVAETGRPRGREGTFLGMRATKKASVS